MKIILVLFLFSFLGCGIYISSDTLNHFAFSASLTSVSIAEHDGENVAEIACFVVGLGLVKEIYDGIYGTGFSSSDLIADFAGASFGAFATDKMINREELP